MTIDQNTPTAAQADDLVELLTWLDSEAVQHDEDDMPITAGMYREAAAIISSLRAENERLQRENDINLTELGRVIMTLPSGTRSEGALQGVKALKARATALQARLDAALEVLKRITEVYCDMEDGDGNPCPDVAAARQIIDQEAGK